MIETPHARDARRRVPVYSLYSETREPTAEMLRGPRRAGRSTCRTSARASTPTSTRWRTACAPRARHGVRVIVCDRPNPIGGDEVEGPPARSGYESFVGQFPIPMRHGMTIGELARLFNEHFGIGAAARRRADGGLARGRCISTRPALPWVMPSPNIPTLDTAIVYPGTVLFEGTILSEGRGTTRPFELVGAPWIDGERFADAMNARGLPGVHFRPAFFEPTFQKHAKQTCGGCQIHVHRSRDASGRCGRRRADRGVPRGRIRHASPGASRPYEYEHDKLPIDILYGSDRLRQADRRRRRRRRARRVVGAGRRGVPQTREATFLLVLGQSTRFESAAPTLLLAARRSRATPNLLARARARARVDLQPRSTPKRPASVCVPSRSQSASASAAPGAPRCASRAQRNSSSDASSGRS